MPTVAELNSQDRDAFVGALGHLFEHSPWVAAGAWPARPFDTPDALHRALCAAMRAAPREQQLGLIRAHPDLAGRLAQQNQLTRESTREQASAGLGRLTPSELAEFQALNDRYRARFGFPFIICARLNQKDGILAAMRQRLSNTESVEFEIALAEIEKIARLRLDDLLRA